MKWSVEANRALMYTFVLLLLIGVPILFSTTIDWAKRTSATRTFLNELETNVLRVRVLLTSDLLSRMPAAGADESAREDVLLAGLGDGFRSLPMLPLLSHLRKTDPNVWSRVVDLSAAGSSMVSSIALDTSTPESTSTSDRERLSRQVASVSRLLSELMHWASEYEDHQGKSFTVLVSVQVGIVALLAFLMLILERRVRRSERATLDIRMFTQAVLQGQERERQRISLELHDSVAQTIASARYQCAAIAPSLNDDTSSKERLEELSRSLKKIMLDVRDISYFLKTPSIASASLVSVVAEVVRGSMKGSRIHFEVHGTPVVQDYAATPDVNAHVVRIVQEALLNVQRHSRARSVSVTIDREDSKVLLWVIDDGSGFRPENLGKSENLFARKMGIVGMQERARMIGGKVHVTSAPGSGTTVNLILPVEEAANE